MKSKSLWTGRSKRKGHAIKWFASILLFFLGVGGTAYAFPSNTRYGYANCSSCHVSPTGGGILTDYGRATAADFLSTDKSANEEQFLHGALNGTPVQESRLTFGGDVRYISIRSQDAAKDPIQNQNFWMQRDTEASLKITKELSIVGAYGFYPVAEHKYEAQARRNYILLDLNQNVSLRAGKFFPAYGILVEDHTVATRQGLGWNEGQETYNAEASLRGSFGELFLTGVLGGNNKADLTQTNGYVLQSDQKGAVMRAAAYIGTGSQVGVSAMYTQLLTPGGGWRNSGGAYAILGITKSLYLLSEADIVKSSLANVPQVFSFNQLGYEVIRGLHVQVQYQRRPEVDEYDLKLQWFPRPHYEVATELEYAKSGQTLFFLLHYYL